MRKMQCFSKFSKSVTRDLTLMRPYSYHLLKRIRHLLTQGTQLYDANKGAFRDLGILDVMQIFGRAGRPQYDDHGEGCIITTHDKLTHYLALMTRQNAIESQFIESLADNLNAEVREFCGKVQR